MPRDKARRVTIALTVDNDFRALTAAEQQLYFVLLRQRDLSACGVITWIPARYADEAADLTVGQLATTIRGLAASRFVIHDVDTDEVLLCPYLVDNRMFDTVPRTRKAARDFAHVYSGAIRQAILDTVPAPLNERWPDIFDLANQQLTIDGVDNPQPAPFPQDTADALFPLPSHQSPVDNRSDHPQIPVDREREVLAAVVRRRMERVDESSTVIHNKAAYRVSVEKDVRESLSSAIRSAVANNPGLEAAALARVLDVEASAPPPAPRPPDCTDCDKSRWIDSPDGDGVVPCPACCPKVVL